VIDPRYRWELLDQWADGPVVAWVLLNPSTAAATEDGISDDHTSTKVRGFSARWGFGGSVIVNLYPFRATRPIDLLHTVESRRLGDRTAADRAILDATAGRSIVLGWGAHGSNRTVRARVAQVLDLLGLPPAPRHLPPAEGTPARWCLGLTKGAQPLHPLTLRYDLPRVSW
jgi:hypothetical protein